jgi:hypothetical protein
MVFLKSLLTISGLTYFEAVLACVFLCLLCMIAAFILNIVVFLLLFFSEAYESLDLINKRKVRWINIAIKRIQSVSKK